MLVISDRASMALMEHLLPQNAKGHLCNSLRSEEIFRGFEGSGLNGLVDSRVRNIEAWLYLLK